MSRRKKIDISGLFFAAVIDLARKEIKKMEEPQIIEYSNEPINMPETIDIEYEDVTPKKNG